MGLQKSKITKLVICLLIFILGIGLGYLIGRGRSRRFASRPGNNSVMNHGLQTITFKNASGTVTLDRDFGTITQIQGSQILLLDNAGQSQTVLSQSNTVIMKPGGPGSLADLKVGQQVAVDGQLDAGNQLEAKSIIVR